MSDSFDKEVMCENHIVNRCMPYCDQIMDATGHVN